MIIRVAILPQRVKYFDTYGDFFDWLFENHHITRDGFFGSSSYKSNEDRSIMQFTHWDLALTVERQGTLEESKL